ncbi:MAG: 50S ribosomal protein L44e [Nitrososphaerales archaeon]
MEIVDPNPRALSTKIPKELRTFCKHCGKHTVHAVSISKRGKQRASSLGARRHAEDKKGYGGQKFPELIRTAKTTKKTTLKVKCTICSKSRITEGIRLRKAEIAA